MTGIELILEVNADRETRKLKTEAAPWKQR